jgi:hypothetical protein
MLSRPKSLSEWGIFLSECHWVPPPSQYLWTHVRIAFEYRQCGIEVSSGINAFGTAAIGLHPIFRFTAKLPPPPPWPHSSA